MYYPLLSVCKPCKLIYFAPGLFPGLTGQTYKWYFFSLLCELAWTCEAKAEIVKFSRAAVNLHMDWGLFIIFVSRLVCLPIQALLGILIWLTAPSHSSCPCFRQMLLHLYLYQQNSGYSSSVKTFYAWGGAESLCLDGIPASEVAVITMENSYH